jgi:hypothetical protein
MAWIFFFSTDLETPYRSGLLASMHYHKPLIAAAVSIICLSYSFRVYRLSYAAKMVKQNGPGD